jgi:hypothetical protein
LIIQLAGALKIRLKRCASKKGYRPVKTRRFFMRRVSLAPAKR